MNKEIRLIVDALSNKDELPVQVVFEALEFALSQAAKKSFGDESVVSVLIDRQSCDHVALRQWCLFDSSIEGHISRRSGVADT